MTSVYMLNLVDRGLIGLLLEPIKRELHLNDSELGFLTGIAFGMFYAVLGLPIARWADRGNRVTITSLAIGLWGLTVMACLFVTSFVQLLLARIAAAVGESGCKPPTYSLVGDYFPDPVERNRAMAIYLTGSPASTLLSFVLGGWLNEQFGWRITFFLMGIPGLLLAVLIKLTIVEPRLRAAAKASATPSGSAGIGVVLRTLWQQRSCRHLTVALILIYTMSLGLWPWFAAFMVRTHGMGTAELGAWLGLIISVGGIVGTLIGGFVASRWFVGDEPGQMRMSAVAVAAVVPCFVAFLTLPQKYQALVALIPLMVVFSAYVGPTYVLLQRLVPDDMRATIMAAIMLLTNLIGFGIGPQVVGILSDSLAPALGKDSLRIAMLVMSLLGLWAAFHFWRAASVVRQDLAVRGA